jgi:ribokinase
LDPAPAHQLNDALLRLIDLIRPNAAEAQALTGIQVPDRDAARSAGTQLLQRGVAAAIVPAGERGDLLVTRDGEHWLARIPVATVDATGAGDAFAAACAVRLAEGATYAEVAVFANAAAALATTQWGAQAGLPNRDAVLALLKTAH